jgi:hypothetical protein
MELNRLTREADEIIRKVVARYNSLYSPTGTISRIDLDLLLDDIRTMYDKFREIGLAHEHEHRKVSVPAGVPPKDEPTGTEEPLKPAGESKTVREAQPVPETKPVQETQLVPQTKPVRETQPVGDTGDMAAHPRDLDDPTKGSEDIPAGPVPDEAQQSSAQKTIADRFRPEGKSIKDTIAPGTGEDENLGSRLLHTSVADLKSVIGLAEKFAFVNELFAGDTLAYEKAIIQLNGSGHLSEAEAYLGTLRLNHKWTADSPLAEQFCEIVRRKFVK